MQKINHSQGGIANQLSTIFHGIVIERRNHNSPITETDLENYVAESVWKTFDKFRPEVGQKLGVPELDLILTDAKVVGIKIDGNRVINPIGFTGRKVEISALITISSKKFNVLKYSHVESLVEEGALNTYAISENAKSENIVYIEIGEVVTKICLKRRETALCIREFRWGEKDILREIGSLLGSDEETSQKIYSRFLSGEVSEIVSEKISRSFNIALKKFIENVSEAISKAKGFGNLNYSLIYVKAPFMPKSLYQRKFILNSKRAKLVEVSSEDFSHKFLEDKEKTYGHLNQLAEKRMKWVSAS